MSTSSFLFLSFFSLFFSCGAWAQYPVISQEVSFVSNAPSGNMTLVGTLTMPEGATGPVPGVVLIAGSGAGQRNETVVYPTLNFVVSPPKYPACGSSEITANVFVDLAEYFTSIGFAVLRYDKRSCVAGSGIPGCQYPLCPLNNTNEHSDCLNMHLLTAWDLVIDASNAVQFLANYEGVDGDNITVIGHSEGTYIAPYVALNSSGHVPQVVLLAGPGMPMTDVVIDQLANQVIFAETLLYSCSVMGVPPKVIMQLEQELNETIILLEQTASMTELILNGTYNSTDLVTWVGPDVPVGYVQSLFDIGQPEALFTVYEEYTQMGGLVLAVNSPTDFQVYPKFYRPLHAVLQSLKLPQTVAIVDEITHVLTPADFSSGEISPALLEAIVTWGQE